MTKFLFWVLNANLLFVSTLHVKNANASRHTVNRPKNSKPAQKGRHSFTLRRKLHTFIADPAQHYSFPAMIPELVASKELHAFQIYELGLLSPVQKLKLLIDNHPSALEQEAYEKGLFLNKAPSIVTPRDAKETIATSISEGVLFLEARPHRLKLLQTLFDSNTIVTDYNSYDNSPIPWVAEKITSRPSESSNDGSLNVHLTNVNGG